MPTKQFPTFAPNQQNLQNQGIQQALAYLKQLSPGKQQPYQFDFAPIAQQAQTQFYGQTVPSLAERFTSLGGEGTSLGSSGFTGALGAAGAGLQENLAALGSQYGLQQQQLGMQQQGQDRDYLLNLLRFALLPQKETVYTPKGPGFGGYAAQGAGGLLATGLQALLSKLGLF